jgi:hypothetical protein
MKAMKEFIEWRDRNISHNQKMWISAIIVILAGVMLGYGMGGHDQYKVSAEYIEAHATTDHIITIPGYGSYQVQPINQTVTVFYGNLTIPEGAK